MILLIMAVHLALAIIRPKFFGLASLFILASYLYCAGIIVGLGLFVGIGCCVPLCIGIIKGIIEMLYMRIPFRRMGYTKFMENNHE